MALTTDLIMHPVGKTATFNVAHLGFVTGDVTGYMQTTDGVPICYEVDTGSHTLVIPWCNILTVT